mgnify:CR=1 FL=1
MQGITKKQKRRLLFLTIITIPLLVLFLSNLFSYWTQIYKNVKDKEQLQTEMNEKLDEEEDLKMQITKLQDPEYIAKYAREKYLMSKNDEIIIRIDDWVIVKR